MNYELLVNYASILMFIIAALVFVTNIVVEVFKNIFPALPTNILAVVVAMLVTGICTAICMAYKEVAFVWYYVPAAIILGLFVAYAAMFGFDKFKEAFDKLRNIEN